MNALAFPTTRILTRGNDDNVRYHFRHGVGDQSHEWIDVFAFSKYEILYYESVRTNRESLRTMLSSRHSPATIQSYRPRNQGSQTHSLSLCHKHQQERRLGEQMKRNLPPLILTSDHYNIIYTHTYGHTQPSCTRTSVIHIHHTHNNSIKNPTYLSSIRKNPSSRQAYII